MAREPTDLAERLRVLEDIEAIQGLKARYWRSMDSGDVERVRDCFAGEDVVVDFDGVPRCETRSAFLTIMSVGAAQTGAHHMHHGKNPRITIASADAASGEWQINYHGVDSANRLIIDLAGRYQDEYVRVSGAWKIRSMQMRLTSFSMAAVDEEGGTRALALGEQTVAAFGQ